MDTATIIHLTLTGSQAGRLLCTADKQAERSNGAYFVHAMYAPNRVWTHPKLCKACKAEWDAAEAEAEKGSSPNEILGMTWTELERKQGGKLKR